MTANWKPLTDELALWRRAGLTLPLWWRDDDAVAPTAALKTLLALQDRLTLPVHLAVIPAGATPALASAIKGRGCVPMVHGWAHENHAPMGAKKAEFNHPREGLTHDTARALERMTTLFGAALLPVFVPPWNRINAMATAALSGQGYAGLSTFTPRASFKVDGLAQINTHVDPIHWKAGGGLAEPDAILAGLVANLQDRRAGKTDASEPLGFLTHHLVHDAAIWGFTERCLSMLLEGGAVACDLSKAERLP